MEGDSETTGGETMPSKGLEKLGVTGRGVKLGCVAFAPAAYRKVVSLLDPCGGGEGAS